MPTQSQAIASLPSLGWIDAPSPLHSLDATAEELGLATLLIKRDDLLPALGGGNKVRKLDILLSQPPYRDAQVWHATGTIGSGHLVATAKASRKLGRSLIAHACDQPLSQGVIDNLAMTTADAHRLHYYSSRASMALRRPHLMVLESFRGEAILPPGATSGAGSAGFVRAAFELTAQLQSEHLQPPERIYLPLGSGGAAIGLAVGLALAKVQTTVHAISSVERIFVTRARIQSVKHALLAWLRSQGIKIPRYLPLRLVVDTSQIGKGYAHPSRASRAAVDKMRDLGIRLEPVYSGKAMAALQHDAPALRGKSLLFWQTNHGIPYAEPASDWMRALPRALQQRLVVADATQ